jgi:hypothetical protein
VTAENKKITQLDEITDIITPLFTWFVTAASDAVDNNKMNAVSLVQYVNANSTFSSLSDVTNAFTTPHALYKTNAAADAYEETGITMPDGAANEIEFNKGTTNLNFTADFNVTATCTIDQDLSTTGSVTHSLFTATSFVQTPTILLTKSGNDPLIQFTEDSTTVGLLSADKTASRIYVTDSTSTYDILTIDTSNNNVGINTASPAADAILDLTSDASKKGALLVPRMTTTDKNSLTAVNGMIVYDSTLNKFQGYENGAWTSFI